MLRAAFISLLLVSTAACGQSPLSREEAQTREAHGYENARGVADTDKALNPYLGKWRPTSFAEQRNISSLFISNSSLALENGYSLTFEIVREDGSAVILRVTGHSPPSAFQTVEALAFSLESMPLKSAKPNQQQTREILRIHWCNSIDQLSAGIGKSTCSINGYTR